MNVLYPMFGMVVLTLLVAPLTFVARVRAIRSGQIAVDFLRLYDGTGAPEPVTKTTRHMANLFEMPTLFYVACLTGFLLQIHEALLVNLGWSYVVFRAAQAFIHLTYNKVYHRLIALMLSNAALYTMWFIIILRGIEQ